MLVETAAPDYSMEWNPRFPEFLADGVGICDVSMTDDRMTSYADQKNLQASGKLLLSISTIDI